MLNVHLSYGKGKKIDHLHLTVGGLDKVTKEEHRWNSPDMRVGGEVKVRIVDATSVDEPETRHPAPEYDAEVEQAHVRSWIKKLSWTVIEKSSGPSEPVDSE